ncbi:DUF4189 domain-containing protein [Xanthomonas vesicatoria]|uniref:DUF4189 domain-containing protein n=1 Tax=Xanthomonas vesicatoria TaxID=56460 RepID=UPI001E4EAA5A|nr:DUF4189 domain-containing protein [Xanthomonas vesicatoria]MCC8616941.1 DUF4189 domain-containing protein [Xanthomonas vesicatoria]MCC8630780.1 DUF4189 domain-containing protein [Xanthomonas vesicatoria]
MRATLGPLLFLAIVFSARAEQGCPPGQYPIGGQGVAACAPIPQGASNQEPRPLGKWIKTWGAVALDESEVGAVGVATGEFSKDKAKKAAILSCTKAGGKDCRDWATYFNQCAAVAEPYKDGKSSGGKLQFNSGPDPDKVKTDAEKNCTSLNNATCRIIYSNCSNQIFEKY